MSEHVDPSIVAILARLRQRQRMLNVLRCGAHGLFYGAVAALALGAAAWLAHTEWMNQSPWLASLAIPLGAVLGLGVGAILPIDDLRLARALDQAAFSEDRFASALQLAQHARKNRTKLIAEDAVGRVSATQPRSALPWRLPRIAKWLPIPLVALIALVLFAPHERLAAAASNLPDISDEDWTSIHNEFQKDLQELPKPQTPQEQDIRKDLENLANLLQQKPEKKDALKEVARLSERVQKQRQSLGMRDLSMKNAAKSLAKSETLKQFSSALKEGNYDKAASEMEKLAEQLKENNSMDAAEFEAMASDMQQMADELASQEELQQACQQCANAANSMNRESLSKSCKNLSNQLKKNSDKLKQCDNCSKCSSMLDKLKRMMNSKSQCKGCKNGCSQCQGNSLMGRNGGKKGGLKAGWGTAAKWDGGDLKKQDEQRLPDMVDAQERNGENTSYKIVSPDERAESALRYEEMFAEFVQKSEADLDLDTVPVAYREYLRKYFNSIKPQEAAPAPADSESSEPATP